MAEYPQIIEHLILFLGTGMSVVAALEAVATEYEKEQRRGNKKEIFVYEQIKNMQTDFIWSSTDKSIW